MRQGMYPQNRLKVCDINTSCIFGRFWYETVDSQSEYVWIVASLCHGVRWDQIGKQVFLVVVATCNKYMVASDGSTWGWDDEWGTGRIEGGPDATAWPRVWCQFFMRQCLDLFLRLVRFCIMVIPCPKNLLVAKSSTIRWERIIICYVFSFCIDKVPKWWGWHWLAKRGQWLMSHSWCDGLSDWLSTMPDRGFAFWRKRSNRDCWRSWALPCCATQPFLFDSFFDTKLCKKQYEIF